MNFLDNFKKLLADFETTIMAEVKVEIEKKMAETQSKKTEDYLLPYMNMQNVKGELKDMDGKNIDVHYAKFSNDASKLEGHSFNSVIKDNNYISGNLIKDTMMRHKESNGKPTYYGSRGALTIDFVDPRYQAFESSYQPTKKDYHTTNHLEASPSHPYWYGRYNTGPRISRGALRNGWGSAGGGHIMKITKPADTSSSGFGASLVFSGKLAVLRNLRFTCYIKIVKGTRVGFGVDSGYRGRVRGASVSKSTTDKSPQGWYKMDVSIGTSNVTNPWSSNFLMGFDKEPEYEVYIALPAAYIVPGDSYRPQMVQEI